MPWIDRTEVGRNIKRSFLHPIVKNPIMAHAFQHLQTVTRLPGLTLLSSIGVLVVLLLIPRVADAENDPDAGIVPLRGQDVWSATMTVGSTSGMLGYGDFSERDVGALSAQSFDWRGTTYEVNNLFYNRRAGDTENWSVVVDISPALPQGADGFECLALRLGDLWLNLADGQGNSRQFFWYDVELPWRSNEAVEVGLREFPPKFETRSISGWGNNLLRTELGMAETQLLRIAAVPFDFAMSASMSDALPEPRTISNILHAQLELSANAAGATDMLWQWGQFLDHDISLTPATVLSTGISIRIPRGDPDFDPFGRGIGSITFDRSIFDPETGTGPDNPREQVNQISSFIDASNVYGSSTERAFALRTNDGTGRLATSGGGLLLPLNSAGLENDSGGRLRRGLFLGGDVRANEQVALTAMHILFVREHNRLADELATAHPELTGHEIFELARKIVGAQMQVISYQEFLPLLLGRGALSPYGGYDSEVDPSVSNEFSTAAFRVGHTMLSPNLLLIDGDGERSEISLAAAFFDAAMVRNLGIEGFLRGLTTQVAQEIDLHLVDEIRNMLFGPPGSPGRDLAALNIQRGRDHGLPRYNVVRRAFGLPRAESFADVSSDPEIQGALELAYEDVENIDVWTGGLAEDHVPGAMVGETFHRIIADQFERLRDGDRFWFQNDPYFIANPSLLAEVRSTTLADIIRRNTTIGSELPDNVFGGPAPRVAIESSSSEGVEGISLQLTFTRTGPTTRPLSVEIAISETGSMLSDESAALRQVTFEPGRDAATLVLVTSQDESAEHDSTILAAVGASDDYEVSEDSASASVLVLDDDSDQILLDHGLNVIQWTGADGVSVAEALRGNDDTDISDAVVAVYQWDEVEGRWLAFFPVLAELGILGRVNSLTALNAGQTYQFRTSQPVVWRIPKAEIGQGAGLE